jgi:hypothetical protein
MDLDHDFVRNGASAGAPWPAQVQDCQALNAAKPAAELRAEFCWPLDPLEVAAILLLIEALAVKGARRYSDAGKDRQSDEGREDGLHDRSPELSCSLRASSWCSQLPYGVFVWF